MEQIENIRNEYFNSMESLSGNRAIVQKDAKGNINFKSLKGGAKIIPLKGDHFNLTIPRSEITDAHPNIFTAQSEKARVVKFNPAHIKETFDAQYLVEKRGVTYFKKETLGAVMNWTLDTISELYPAKNSSNLSESELGAYIMEVAHFKRQTKSKRTVRLNEVEA